MTLADDTMILRVRKSARERGSSGMGSGASAEGGALPPPKVGSAVNESEWMALEEMRKGALALWGQGGAGAAAGGEEGVDQETWEKRKFEMLSSIMTEPPTLEQFRWALDCVQSRSFALDTLQGAKCVCLCPMADLFNHDPAAPASLDFSPERAHFQLRTRRAWAKQQEVRITYGELSNADLLQYYGFVLEHNAHDSVYMSLTHLAPVIPRAAIGSEADRLDRLTILASLTNDNSLALSHTQDSSRLLMKHTGPTKELMMVARVLSLNRTALAMHHGRLDHLAARIATGKPLELHNELAAWRLLSAACQMRLARMPTSLEEDLEWLDRQDKGIVAYDAELRLCVAYRVALKRLLIRASDVLDGYMAATLRVGTICTILVPPAQSSFLVADHSSGRHQSQDSGTGLGELETWRLGGVAAESASALLLQAMEAMGVGVQAQGAPEVDWRGIDGRAEEIVERGEKLAEGNEEPLRDDGGVGFEDGSGGQLSRDETGGSFMNLVESVLDVSVPAANDVSPSGSPFSEPHSSAAPTPEAWSKRGAQKRKATTQFQGRTTEMVGGVVKGSRRAGNGPEGGLAARLEARSLLRALRGQDQQGGAGTGSAGGVIEETMEIRAAECMRELAASLGSDTVERAGGGQQVRSGAEDGEGAKENDKDDEVAAVEGLMDAIALFGEPGGEDGSREESIVGNHTRSKRGGQFTGGVTGNEALRRDRHVRSEEVGTKDERQINKEAMEKENPDGRRERGRGKGMRWDRDREEFEFFF